MSQSVDDGQITTTVKAKVRAIGNSLGIILPKKLLNDACISKGDEISIIIDVEELLKTQRLKKILSVKGCMKHLRGTKPLNYDTDDIDEADKPEYERFFE